MTAVEVLKLCSSPLNYESMNLNIGIAVWLERLEVIITRGGHWWRYIALYVCWATDIYWTVICLTLTILG